tara:strand:- start:16541 stop:17812 length:1272 start_codon:yes stop_codon:yes gene_type:complete
MLSLQLLKQDPEGAIQALTKRNIDARQDIKSLLDKNEKRRKIQNESETLKAESNKIAKIIGNLVQEGETDKIQEIKIKSKYLKAELTKLEKDLIQIESEEKEILLSFPNIPHKSVKKGKGEKENEIIKSWGDLKTNPNSLPHWELSEKYKLIDFERGVKVTGAGFPVYTGKGARLQRALIQYFLDTNTESGYKEIQPPYFVNEKSSFGTGQLPDKEGQMYHIEDDQLYAIPTSEIPLTNLYRNEIINETDLPIKLTAYSPCFRREAGSYGKDVRGLNRLHQFDKVEIVHIEKQSDSYDKLHEMTSHVSKILEELGLKYRLLRLCGGDMGFTSSMTYDFEVWSSAQERWLEVSSVSNFETFQSRRLQLRYRSLKNNEILLAHTLNGSALALPRIMAAILENNQSEEGIKIPEALWKYTGFKIIK